MSGKRLCLDETVPPGPRAFKEAERLRTRLLKQVDDKRHLRMTVLGRVRPRPEGREELPELLGVPLRKCFTPEILEKPYDGRRAWGVPT